MATGLEVPATAPAGAGGRRGALKGGCGVAAAVVMVVVVVGAAQPQAACAAHPGAVVSWSPAPAARQRLI